MCGIMWIGSEFSCHQAKVTFSASYFFKFSNLSSKGWRASSLIYSDISAATVLSDLTSSSLSGSETLSKESSSSYAFISTYLIEVLTLKSFLSLSILLFFKF